MFGNCFGVSSQTFGDSSPCSFPSAPADGHQQPGHHLCLREGKLSVLNEALIAESGEALIAESSELLVNNPVFLEKGVHQRCHHMQFLKNERPATGPFAVGKGRLGPGTLCIPGGRQP